MRMSVGVDLHKSQFTVYWRSDDGIAGKHERYPTSDDGYRRFEAALQSVIETGTHRILERHDRLKRIKGSGRSIIATARQLSEIIYRMLTDGVPFDETKMVDPVTRRKVTEMQAAAYDAAS